MAKRNADTEINHDNWDQEQEEEDAGVFRIAAKEVMEKREIKKAKRRMPAEESVGSGTSAFKGFSFTSKTETKGMPPSRIGAFSFGATATATITSSTSSPFEKTSQMNTGIESESEYRKSLRILNESVSKWVSDHVKSNPYCILTPVFNDYEKYIKEIGVDSSSSPDTKQFEQKKKNCDDKTSSNGKKTTSSVVQSSMSGICVGDESTKEMKAPAAAAAAATTTTTGVSGFNFVNTLMSKEKTSTASGFGFMAPTPPKDTMTSSGFSFSASISKETSIPTGFSFTSSSAFGAPSSSQASSSPGFSFASSIPKETSVPTSGFSFGGGINASSAAAASAASPPKPFTFGFGLQQPSNKNDSEKPGVSTTEGGEDDGEYVPPKAEVVDIKEDDAFHTIRCKLYYKIDKEFKERGTGNLYLKHCGEKTQLLIRADTALGNILLNIMLQESIPASRQGNKVMLVCVPNPPIKNNDEKIPIVILIRVKTEDDAETLLNEINKNKN